MATPLLTTKLYIPPPLPNLVERPRLVKRLDEGLRLGHRFLAYLVAALQTIEGTVGQGLLAALQSPGAVNVESVLTTLINEIAGLPYNPSTSDRASASGLVLVLDDYHVIESQPIDKALTFLLDHLPPPPGGMHLGIASRSDPALPLSRLRARRQLTELREGDESNGLSRLWFIRQS